VLTNDKFVEWANENIVCVVGHNEKEHPTEYEDAKGKMKPGCPLYRGLACEDHQKMVQEVMSPPEGLPKIAVGNGMPNSWLVAPDGTVVEIPRDAQQVASKIQEQVEEIQKKAGKVVTWKDYEKLNDSFAAGAKAVEAGDWKVAIGHYGAIDKKAAKLPESVGKRLKERVEALNAKVVEAFEAVKGEADVVQRDKDMKALRAKVSAKIGTAALPVLADIEAWLKANPLPK
jgi:hypothetical protein